MRANVESIAKTLGWIDPTVKFVENRSVPRDNLFWQENLEYIGPSLRFLYIPSVLDTALRLKLIEDSDSVAAFLELHETVAHYSVLVESLQLPINFAIVRFCYEKNIKSDWVKKLILDPQCRNPLMRADGMLLAFPPLGLGDENGLVSFARSILRLSLFLDDWYDVEADRRTKEMNSILVDSESIASEVTQSLAAIASVNPTSSKWWNSIVLPKLTAHRVRNLFFSGEK